MDTEHELEEMKKSYQAAQSLSDLNKFVVIKDYFFEDEKVYINKMGDMAQVYDKKAQFVGHYDPENGYEDLDYYGERTGLEEPEYWKSLKPFKSFVFKKKKAEVPKLESRRPPPLEIPPPRPVATGLNLTGRAPQILQAPKMINPRPPTAPPPAYFKMLYGKHIP